MGNHILGTSLALFSALVYGGADFFGGVATKRLNPSSVLTAATAVGILPMLFLAVIFKEPWPTLQQTFWSISAGLAGVIGLSLLYYGIARGNVAVVSPISGVVSAIIPVIFAVLTIDFPKLANFVGFMVAIIGIWLVAQEKPQQNESPEHAKFNNVTIGIFSGVCFGIFFISLANIKTTTIFGPLAISKVTEFIVGLVYIIIHGINFPSIQKNFAIVLAGILDPVANGLYILATQLTRIDLAAVLSSLYPAGTVLLAYLLLKSPIHKKQWFGAGLCLIATALIMS